jgi:tricorn protease
MPPAFLSLFLALAADPSQVRLPRYPAASPDGSSVVFSWHGDLWRVPAAGGEAVRLTTNPADESRSCFTPDGTALVFESGREGSRNLWVIPAAGGEPRQLTFGDASVSLGGVQVATDGTVRVTADSMREGDLYRAPRPYRVPLAGGVLERVHDAFGSQPVAAKDGRVLFDRGGSSWLRRGYRGPDARDVWMFTPGVPVEQAFQRLTSWAGNDGQPQWLGEDAFLYLSDRDGPVSLYRRQLDAEPPSAGTRLTELPDDVTGYSLSADGSTVFLTCWDKLYRLDLRSPGAAPQPLAVTAAGDGPDPVEMKTVNGEVTEAQLSPDGKTMAFVAWGDVYVRAMDDKSPSVRVTHPPFTEREIAWSADGTRLYFVSDAQGQDDIMEAVVARTRSEIRKEAKASMQPPAPPAVPEPAETSGTPPTDTAVEPEETTGPVDGAPDAAPVPEATPEPAPAQAKPDPRLDPSRWTEAVTFEIRPVVQTTASERQPDESPDGKTLAFRRVGDLVLLDRASGSERVFRGGWDQSIDWCWSPDARWLAFSQDDRDFNRDIWLAPTDGSAAPVNLTRHPDNDRSPRFSADGKLMAFLSDRVENESDVWVVALDPSVEALTPAETEAYFKDAGEAAKKRKPLPGPNAKPEKRKDEGKKDDDTKEEKPAPDAGPAYRLDDAYLRVRRLTRLAGSEGGLQITPAGDRIVFSGNDGTPAVLSVKWDGGDQKKVAAGGRPVQMSLTGDKVVVLNAGRASTAPPAGGEAKAVEFAAVTPVDRQAWRDHRFIEAARTFGEAFYDPTMKGLDWPALVDRYRELAAGGRTDSEFEWCMARLMGELNASHTGVSVPDGGGPGSRRPAGRLGARTRAVEGGFQVLAVLPQGPAERSQTPLLVGDVITTIGGEPVKAGDVLEERLRGRVDQETLITVRRVPAGAAEAVSVDCLITPCSGGAESALLYKDAVATAAGRVRAWSGDRLGYIHIQSMNQPSLEDFERDLCAAAQGKDGLIVDVRNNGGGSTADRVLASLMVQPHAYTVPRGADSGYTGGYPQDRLFIQRWTLPTNMLCNEKSFSNAEIVSHAFRNLKRGTLVGEQTNGGVISTGGAQLVDGTTVRLPFRGWYTPDGVDMENNGAMPDLRVPADPVAESLDQDAQLRAAVDDLMQRLPKTDQSGKAG